MSKESNQELDDIESLRSLQGACALTARRLEAFVTLCKAIDYSDVEAVRLCVANNSGIGIWVFSNMAGRTGLMRAAIVGSLEVVKILLPVSDPNQKGEEGVSALALAVLTGKEDCAHYLLEHTDFAAASFPKGKTFLMLAAGVGSGCVGRVLGKSNPDAQDEEGKTALMHAVWGKARLGVLDSLVEASDCTLRDARGRSAADHALQANAWPMLDAIAMQIPLEECADALEKGRRRIREFRLPSFDFPRCTARLEYAQLTQELAHNKTPLSVDESKGGVQKKMSSRGHRL